MSCVLNSAPDVFDIFEPAVGGSFVADATPDAFLRVQPGLVTGQVSQAEPGMGPKKELNLFAFVPAGSIDIQPDGIAVQMTIKRFEANEKALSIACGHRRQPCPSEQWSNPAEKVQPFVMVTGRRHFQPPSFLGPTQAQPGVQAESGLIFKDNRFMRSQILEFFLEHAEIAGLLPNWPADKNNRPVLDGIPIDASIAGLVSPSALCQTFDSNAVPVSARPTEHGSGQLPRGSFPDRPLSVRESDLSTVPDAPADLWASKSRSRAHLLGESIHSGFDDLWTVHHRSIQVAVPPPIATMPQSSLRHEHPEFLVLSMPVSLGSPPDESTQYLDFSCHHYTAALASMSIYLCRLY